MPKPNLKIFVPMLATSYNTPFNDSDWLFEIKWDGYRIIAVINNGKASLFSRNLISFTQKFKSLALELEKVFEGRSLILDGEVVAFDQNGNPSFQLLQDYELTPRTPIVYYCFDLLWLDGESLLKHKLINRKAMLWAVLPKSKLIRFSRHILVRGIKLYELAKAQKLEGIIAKKIDSLYVPGVRTKNWLKIKVTSQMEAIICGYTLPRGSRMHFGSLVLGAFVNGQLKYIGNVGTGFDERAQAYLIDIFQRITKVSSDFKTFLPGVVWLKPVLVCEIKYAEITKGGLLRQPVFLGLRLDKKPKEVTFEK